MQSTYQLLFSTKIKLKIKFKRKTQDKILSVVHHSVLQFAKSILYRKERFAAIVLFLTKYKNGNDVCNIVSSTKILGILFFKN
ncbi:MAG: hypothetical protein B7C24_16490 [Bacteroidetes bacterium 4572_77]|nr:MAG: hypothetical protein B7C24_16490 [Bacteroidetes bacterium 4572_77]